MEDQKILRSPVLNVQSADNVVIPKHGPVNPVYEVGRDKRIAASKTGPIPVSKTNAEHLDRLSNNSRKDIPTNYPQPKKNSAFQEKMDGALKKAIPIAVGGADIDEIMNGAKDAYNDYLENDICANECYQYAAIRNILYRKGKTTEILVNYEPSLHYFSEWWKQLYGESEGKDKKGVFPASVDFSTDLHSWDNIFRMV
jgi:hypothetical protein